MTHRGPDEDGYLLADGAALGMRRLSVIDLSTGRQPVYNEDRSVAIVYNGEVYNFRELRHDLEARGHRFQTGTDTECIVHLYEEHGERCVEHLRGMFAFALWDQPRRRLLLARDRVGKKPLYYRVTPDGIWFGSELKALLQDRSIPRSVDPAALHRYLTYGYVPAPQAIFAGFRKLLPAHTLSYEDGAMTERRYWRLSYAAKARLAEEDAAEALREAIREAIRIRLPADRPLGAFLSGGVSSSVVVAAMAEQMPEPVKTFSIGFEDMRPDELAYARLVAERFGTDHHELMMAPAIDDLLPWLSWHYGEPFADSSAIPSYYLAEMTRRDVVVALSGDGGDASFGGGDRPVGRPPSGRVHVLRRLKRGLSAALHTPATRYAEAMAQFTNEEKSTLYTDEMKEAVEGLDAYDLVAEAFAASDAGDPLDATMDVDVRTSLPGDLLVKMDIATMANSLEARSPLLDHKVMELAASLPSEFKLRQREGRWLLKRAARGWLPDAVLDRPKRGFGVPVGDWLRHDLRDLARDALTDDTARSRPYFNWEAVEDLLDEHEAGVDHSRKIWTLLAFELWHRTFIDGHSMIAPGIRG